MTHEVILSDHIGLPFMDFLDWLLALQGGPPFCQIRMVRIFWSFYITLPGNGSSISHQTGKGKSSSKKDPLKGISGSSHQRFPGKKALTPHSGTRTPKGILLFDVAYVGGDLRFGIGMGARSAKKGIKFIDSSR